MKARPELDQVLHLGLTRRSVEAVFKEMDLDGDGEITVRPLIAVSFICLIWIFLCIVTGCNWLAFPALDGRVQSILLQGGC